MLSASHGFTVGHVAIEYILAERCRERAGAATTSHTFLMPGVAGYQASNTRGT